MSIVYEPEQDSYFFVKILKEYLQRNPAIKKVLDMGTGSGILALAAASVVSKENVVAADINSLAVQKASKQGLHSVQSDLFTNINQTFDLIIFNAPYLPRDSREPKESQRATTGGKKGDEIAVKFLKQAKKYLAENGKILLLVSSLTPRKNINTFKPEVIARKKLFQEELAILQFSK